MRRILLVRGPAALPNCPRPPFPPSPDILYFGRHHASQSGSYLRGCFRHEEGFSSLSLFVVVQLPPDDHAAASLQIAIRDGGAVILSDQKFPIGSGAALMDGFSIFSCVWYPFSSPFSHPFCHTISTFAISRSLLLVMIPESVSGIPSSVQSVLMYFLSYASLPFFPHFSPHPNEVGFSFTWNQ